jgi:hypothetical protein
MSALNRLRKAYVFVRWTLKPPRYLGRFLRSTFSRRRRTASAGSVLSRGNDLHDRLRTSGYGALLATKFELPEVDLAPLTGTARGVPFFNALPMHWERFKPLICEILTEPKIADCILRYFDGNPWLWNVALNYSEESNVAQDSQLWHFDYGDVKQLHVMLYFTDVDAGSGPFTFLPAEISDRVPRAALTIERLTDEDLAQQHGIDVGSAVRLIGKRHDCFVADPGRVMHQGARCSKPRLVLFMTFTTPTPMSTGGHRTLRAAERRDLFRHYESVAGAQAAFREEFFI